MKIAGDYRAVMSDQGIGRVSIRLSAEFETSFGVDLSISRNCLRCLLCRIGFVRAFLGIDRERARQDGSFSRFSSWIVIYGLQTDPGIFSPRELTWCLGRKCEL